MKKLHLQTNESTLVEEEANFESLPSELKSKILGLMKVTRLEFVQEQVCMLAMTLCRSKSEWKKCKDAIFPRDIMRIDFLHSRPFFSKIYCQVRGIEGLRVNEDFWLELFESHPEGEEVSFKKCTRENVIKSQLSQDIKKDVKSIKKEAFIRISFEDEAPEKAQSFRIEFEDETSNVGSFIHDEAVKSYVREKLGRQEYFIRDKLKIDIGGNRFIDRKPFQSFTGSIDVVLRGMLEKNAETIPLTKENATFKLHSISRAEDFVIHKHSNLLSRFHAFCHFGEFIHRILVTRYPSLSFELQCKEEFFIISLTGAMCDENDVGSDVQNVHLFDTRGDGVGDYD
jgi:hypothetical protein